MNKIRILDSNGTFQLDNAEDYNYLFFPIASCCGLKGAITPNLGGDSKLSQESFLLEPVSVENLHNNRSTRNVWCLTDGKKPWSLTGNSAEAENDRFTEDQEESSVTAGFLWHKINRKRKDHSLSSEITSFVPWNENVEIMIIKISNETNEAMDIRLVSATPIYGRSADNIRDHRNVTSMLHRIKTVDNGVIVKPTMSFDERGHGINHMVYYAFGTDENGNKPEGFIPTVEKFIGEGGTFTHPKSIYRDLDSVMVESQAAFEGREASGVICFKKAQIPPHGSLNYVVMMGIAEDTEDLDLIIKKYGSYDKAKASLDETKEYWKQRANVDFNTGNLEYDNFLKWVSFQPFLRAIYGCSFLPYHDYGRGGRGWRDLWQDCLSLLIMDPRDVRSNLLNNIKGVRIDGTNATIIGTKPGEFIADRNGIQRVWMDHGVWPFKTILFYINQTGDSDILWEMAPYFKDAAALRAEGVDEFWNIDQGLNLLDKSGVLYQGTVLEHILVQHVISFFEVGEHGMLRLRGADWNDALDMADKNGESVAFTAAFAGNMGELSKLLKKLSDSGIKSVKLFKELADVIDCYDIKLSVEEKKKILREYLLLVKHDISGEQVEVDVLHLAKVLSSMRESLMEDIIKNEWLMESEDLGWFNSYYDNSKNKVERVGTDIEEARMMLTGQVFTIMSGYLEKKRIKAICNAADKYLYKKEIGGYRLNTDFKEVKTDLGRMFGFSYGDKENGAVFSHMAVMYAAALYSQGFSHEGFKVLKSLSDTAMDFETSVIYPGIPEYFRADGRGMYHYLTGAASWYLMTMVTEVFGVRGSFGNLLIDPKLVREQFSDEGKAVIRLTFAGKKIEIRYINDGLLDAGEYSVNAIKICDELFQKNEIDKNTLSKLSDEDVNIIEVILK